MNAIVHIVHILSTCFQYYFRQSVTYPRHITQKSTGGRAEIENVMEWAIFPCFSFHLCHQRALFKLAFAHFYNQWSLSKKTMFRFLKDGLAAE